MSVYNNPEYYEVAFSFIDVKRQVNLFERFIEKYSKVKVKRVLDIGCGPSLQLRELARRGYEAIGLDTNYRMLDYLKRKAKEVGVKVEVVQADMNDFKLKSKVDFTFTMMGSFSFKSNDELLRHLDCVSKSLRKGGLYLIENMELDWLSASKPQTWTMRRDGIEVRTTYKTKQKDMLSQTFEEILILNVDDHGRSIKLFEKEIVKHIFPQEFLALLKANGKFEFLGWFERFRFRKLKKASNNNIVILRKK